MIQRKENYFSGTHQTELFYQVWSRAESDFSIVVVHGLGEHSECYHRLAKGLEPLKCNIYAMDLRGHGRSEGKRGVVENFQDYISDLGLFIQGVKSIEGDKPLMLLGHSMGGLIASKYILDNGGSEFKALILSSPLLKIAVSVPKIKNFGAQVLAQTLPNLTMYNEIETSDVTTDVNVIEELDKDPLRHDRISSRLFLQMNEACEYVLDRAVQIKHPMIMQRSGTDIVVSTEANKKFFDQVSSADKTLITYEKSNHEIYNDIERDQVFSDLKKWITDHI